MAYQWKNQFGNVIIKESAVKSIAGTTSMECYGIAGFCIKNGNGEAKLLRGKKRYFKGIEIHTNQSRLDIELSIAVIYGVDIELVCRSVIKTVRQYVQKLTGFRVGRICVKVEGIVDAHA